MEELSKPLSTLAEKGSTKVLRTKAKAALKAHQEEMSAMAEDSGDEDEEQKNGCVLLSSCACI